MTETLRSLCAAAGVSGEENTIAGVITREMEKYTDNIRTDALGNVIAEVGTGSRRLMLAAHMDQIGFVVTAVDDETGFVRFDRVGGCDRRVLAAERVCIHGRREIPAVIVSTPPHLLEKDEENKALPFDRLAADTGLEPGELKNLVSPGDRMTVCPRFEVLTENRVCASFSDDRVGVLVILRTLEILREKSYDYTLYPVFCVQEETGGSGAVTGTFGIAPDEGIAVDVSFASAPDTGNEVRAKLGKGVLIGFAPGLSGEMSRTLVGLCEQNAIAYQYEVMGRRTGTDADDMAVSRAGVKTGLLSIPQRNMHTAAEIIDLRDVESCAQLLAAYICRKEEKGNV